jgi:hypothetical protein
MPVKRPAPFDETFSAYERSAALRELLADLACGRGGP